MIQLLWPVEKRFPITQKFGENPQAYLRTKGHNGVDFGTPAGTVVRAAAAGRVVTAGLDPESVKNPLNGYGSQVRILHAENLTTIYAQLSEILVKPDQEVAAGELIARSGNSGRSTGPHLHFELRTDQGVESAIDPEPYLVDLPDSGGEQHPTLFRVIVTPGGNDLNLRTRADTTAGILRRFSAGETLEVWGIGGQDAWLHTSQGYLHYEEEALRIEPKGPDARPDTLLIATAMKQLRLRAAPASAAKVTTVLESGNPVEVNGLEGQVWLGVKNGYCRYNPAWMQIEGHSGQPDAAEAPASEEESGATETGPGKKTTARRTRKGVPNPPAFQSETLENTLIYQKGGTLIRVALTPRLWATPLDGLAIPAMFPQMDLRGSFSAAWFKEIDKAAQKDILGLIGSVKAPEGRMALGIELAADLGARVLPYGGDGKRTLILANAWGQDRADSLARLPELLAQIIAAAREARVERLGMPLIGSGERWLSPLEVLGPYLDALLGELDLSGLAEITIATLQPAAVEAARKKFNLYRNNLAQSLSADDAVEKDTLGIGPQVDALAETLMLRSTGAGLAVGILGSWGSGKTSVMRMIERRAREVCLAERERLKAEEGQGAKAGNYVAHVFPIWFNAWTYTKSNLWASLMDTIFVTLDNRLREEPGATSMWEILRQRKEVEWNELRLSQEKLVSLKAQQSDAEAQAREAVLTELGDAAQNAALAMLKEKVQAVAGGYASERMRDILARANVTETDASELIGGLRSLEVTLRRLVGLAREHPQALLAWLVFALMCASAPALLSAYLALGAAAANQLSAVAPGAAALLRVVGEALARAAQSIDSLVIQAAALIPLALPLVNTLAGWARQANELMDAYEKRAESERARMAGLVDERLKQRRTAGEIEVNQVLNDFALSPGQIEVMLQQKIDQAPANLAAYPALARIIEARVEEQKRKIGPAGQFTTLAEFVAARLDSGLYEKELGLMHRVERDIADLSTRLVEYFKVNSQDTSTFPYGPVRVILFIDDLDRCPPLRVVEVLEAVQLLVKTPLFVVVLGVDTRYATRALEKVYADILVRQGDPSGLDYIEKIIQIPYRVRPIEKSGLESFLREEMKFTGRADDGGGNAGRSLDAAGPTVPGGATPPAGAGQLPAGQADQVSASDKIPPVDRAIQPRAAGTSPEEPLPPQVIEFSEEDFEDLRACCGLVLLTPRSVKRLVNVMRLLEVFWFRRLGRMQTRRVKQGALALLALAAAYPEVMAEVFVNMETRLRNPLHENDTLRTYLDGLEAEEERRKLQANGVMEWQLNQLLEACKGMQALKVRQGGSVMDFLACTFKDLGAESFDLARSFSFVGDPAYALQDAPLAASERKEA